MIVKGGFVHVAFALIKRITINTDMLSCSSLKKKQVGGFHWEQALYMVH